MLEGADVPIIEGEGGHVQELLSALDAFHEFAQAHYFAVPRQPAYLGLEAREWHMQIGRGALAGCAARDDVVIAQNCPGAPRQTRGSGDSDGVQADVEQGAEHPKDFHVPKQNATFIRAEHRFSVGTRCAHCCTKLRHEWHT